MLCSFLACTDKELRNLASRLKDWFGALHEDANRVIKPTSSETAQGSKKTPFPPEHWVLWELPSLRELNWVQLLVLQHPVRQVSVTLDLILQINAVFWRSCSPYVLSLAQNCSKNWQSERPSQVNQASNCLKAMEITSGGVTETAQGLFSSAGVN